MIDIQHYGFDSAPVALIHLLKSFDFLDNKRFIIFDPLNGVDFPYEKIQLVSKKNLHIVITTHEGASHLWFDRLLDKLVNQCQIPISSIILRSACLYNPTSTVKHIHTIVDECSDFIYKVNDLNLEMTPHTTHHYVCLNRLHRWQRYALVSNLLDQGLDTFGKISYIKKPPNCADHRFPIMLDYKNKHSDVSWQEQRDISHPAIVGALLNVIAESAYEVEPGAVAVELHYLPVMSEKSYKCFAMHQIPIWLAPYRSVDCYRNLGFDVFDDYVDHSYDLEPDPVRRVKLVADQIKNFCARSNLNKVRQQLHSRFLKNIQTLKLHTHHEIELPQWKKILV